MESSNYFSNKMNCNTDCITTIPTSKLFKYSLIIITTFSVVMSYAQQVDVTGTTLGGTVIKSFNDDISTINSSAIFGEGLQGVRGLALGGHHQLTKHACGVCGISNYKYSHGVYGELTVNSVSSAVRGSANSKDGYGIHGTNDDGIGAYFRGKKFGVRVSSTDTTGAIFSGGNGTAAYFNGKIGVLTDFPEKALDVRGEAIFKETNKIATFQSSGSNSFIQLQSNENGDASDLGNFDDGNNKYFFINVPSATFGDLIIGYNGNISMGGDETPDVKLDVIGSIHYTGSISDVSDIRLKENIEKIKNPLHGLLSLNGFTYNLIGENQRSAGVSAQEVLGVLPEAVSQIEDDFLGVDYTQLVPLLIEAIKEQQEIIEEQHRQLEEQERRFSVQNSEIINIKHKMDQMGSLIADIDKLQSMVGGSKPSRKKVRVKGSVKKSSVRSSR